MSSPLANWGGKPILGGESPDNHYVGRIVIELYEGPHITSDTNGLVFSVSPGAEIDITQYELLKRVAVALPARIVKEAAIEEGKRKIAEEKGGIYE